MRESIGGGWLLGIVALFIALFSGYLALSLNHSKAYKVKNKIINVIEDNQGISPSAESIIKDYLSEISYKTVQISQKNCDKYDSTYYNGGYCVKEIKVCYNSENAVVENGNTDKSKCEGRYYKVTTFTKVELPLFNFSINVPLHGETKVIYLGGD